MAKKTDGKKAKGSGKKGPAMPAMPPELTAGAIDAKALARHPVIAELAASALEALAADIRAKAAKATAPAAAPAATPVEPAPAAVGESPAKAAKPAKTPARPRTRKATAPGTPTKQ